MDALIVIGCVIGGLVATYLLIVIIAALVVGVRLIIQRRRIIKRQQEIRKRLARQGAPFQRLERRTMPLGLRTAY